MWWRSGAAQLAPKWLSDYSVVGRYTRWCWFLLRLFRQVGHFFWAWMAALMHFWQKMWPQTVDVASVSSFMHIGQVNFGSFGTSFTGSGGALKKLTSGVSTKLITGQVLVALRGWYLRFMPRDSSVFTCSSRASPKKNATCAKLLDTLWNRNKYVKVFYIIFLQAWHTWAKLRTKIYKVIFNTYFLREVNALLRLWSYYLNT